MLTSPRHINLFLVWRFSNSFAFFLKYGIIDTEEAGTLVFSWVPAFFVTIVLLVQCSVKQKFIVVQPMKTSL